MICYLLKWTIEIRVEDPYGIGTERDKNRGTGYGDVVMDGYKLEWIKFVEMIGKIDMNYEEYEVNVVYLNEEER